MGDDEATSAIARYFQSHHIRFVLCDDDGAEIQDVEPEQVATVAHGCSLAGRGYVKQIAIPLNSIPQVWP